MDSVRPCNTYSAQPAGFTMYRNDRNIYKIYHVDIVGREQPERYEWDLCGRSRDSVPEALQAAGVEGVGFVVAFPHITKVFRFAPSAETIMHVRAFSTPDFSEIDLQREEGYIEFACYAEALIAADEYRYWAESGSVEEYLERQSNWHDGTIVSNDKLARHFA